MAATSPGAEQGDGDATWRISSAAIDSSDLELQTLMLTCLSESCTAQAGRVRAVARFVDGSEQTIGEWEYVGSGP